MITQGYLCISPNEEEVRIRRRDDKCTLTVKSGSGISREEAEVEISIQQFESLLPACGGRVLLKRRYEYPLQALTAEVDVYEGQLAGLQVVEVEFSSVEDANAFVPPNWFGEEKTDDRVFKNAALVTNRYSDLLREKH